MSGVPFTSQCGHWAQLPHPPAHLPAHLPQHGRPRAAGRCPTRAAPGPLACMPAAADVTSPILPWVAMAWGPAVGKPTGVCAADSARVQQNRVESRWHIALAHLCLWRAVGHQGGGQAVRMQYLDKLSAEHGGPTSLVRMWAGMQARCRPPPALTCEDGVRHRPGLKLHMRLCSLGVCSGDAEGGSEQATRWGAQHPTRQLLFCTQLLHVPGSKVRLGSSTRAETGRARPSACESSEAAADGSDARAVLPAHSMGAAQRLAAAEGGGRPGRPRAGARQKTQRCTKPSPAGVTGAAAHADRRPNSIECNESFVRSIL